MYKKLHEHSLRIITFTFVIIVFVAVLVYVAVVSQRSPTAPSRRGTHVFTNADRVAILSQRSNIPDINPVMTEGQRLKLLGQPGKTTSAPKIKK